MSQHDSQENAKEFIVTSPHVMPCPIVSRIVNANHECKHNHECEPKNECDCCETFASQQNITTCQDTSCKTDFHASQPNY